MNCPRVSIGIPIYNREAYIEQCASSLFSQTYSNIEYVFVDDCSTDKSIEILKKIIAKFPERAENVRLLSHKENGGLWKARNSCIENMTGDYFMFCDADDWMETDAVSKMVDFLRLNNCDVVSTLLYENIEDKQSCMTFKTHNDAVSDLNNISLDVEHFSLCGKLFNSGLFIKNDLRVFDGVSCWEDLCIVARVFALTRDVRLYNEPFYHYRKSDQESLSRSENKAILEQHLICADKLISWFNDNKKDVEYMEFLKFLKFTAKIKMLRGRDKQVKRWKETYPEANVGIMNYRFVPFRFKLLFISVNILPTWFSQGVCNFSNLFYKN